VIPAAAMAKVSMRLVPDQSAAAIADRFEAYLARAAPRTMALTVTRLITGDPWMCDRDNPFVRAASRAMEYGFERRPVFIREGGSNAIGPLFQAELGAPIVLFGIGLPTENAHAPNEHLDLENFHRGVIATARLYEEIGAIR
jgi:acetylornithine deacetylase/succinyl-diaminopimelate desuccinylase-like protein